MGDGKVVFAWIPQPICGTTVVQQGFMDSFVKFVTHDGFNRQVFGGYTVVNAGYIPSSRDKACAHMLSTPHEWLLFLDWDITYDPEDVYALIDSADPVERPIVGGVYVTFMGAEPITLRPCFMVETEQQEYTAATGFTVGEMTNCSSIGMGFTLIHRSVLEALRDAYAEDPWHYFGHDIVADTQDGHLVRVGEDMTFADRARKLGFTIWANGSVMVGHTKAKEFRAGDMEIAGTAYQQPPIAVGKTVLNLGGASKQIPLPFEYRGCTQVLLDINSGPDVDIVMDARKLYEDETIASDSLDAVYMSHVIEHFDNHDIATVLKGVHRVLKPGGVIDIYTPDMEQVFDALASGKEMDDEAYQSAVGPILYRDILYGLGSEIERSGNDHYAHRTGFTESRLVKVLGTRFENVTSERKLGLFELHAKATKA